jgi:LacI family transcriptional regulator
VRKHGRVTISHRTNNINIIGIARLAGVTKSTVSKALNNYPGVHTKTKERILKIVADLGYEPNSAARMLASRRTGSIGLVIPHSPEHSMNSSYWASLVGAITNESIKLGYTLSLLLPQAEGHMKELFTSVVRKRMVDGLLIGAELLDKQQLATLLYTRTPFVLLGRNPDFSHHCVDIDNRAAGFSIADYLLTHGYKRPIFVGGPSEYYYNAERAAGFMEAVRASGLEPLEPLYFPYEEHDTIHRVLKEKVRILAPDSAVIGAGGYFMFSAVSVFTEMELRPPQFGFATFDDDAILDFLKPPITAVSQPVSRMGGEAVSILVRLMKAPKDESGPNQCAILPTSIVSRASCGESQSR